ncbi:MAG: hypothetical protein JXC32_10310, partial [Anaerolineae bacterium]|nr:hypothetical protein [Anaerolineae bacterium]
NNYWGHPDGPTHLTNPDGLGDIIRCSDSASEIDFDPWLTSHACGISDLAVANIEVVQTVQTISNTVPLVAEKGTVVRVYPDVGIGFATVDGTLTGSRDGQELGTVQARAPIGAGSITDWDATRLDAGASLIFDLPADWLHGVITLRADVSPVAQAASCSADGEGTASLTTTATFHERKPVTFAYIPASVDALTGYLPVTPKEILEVHDKIMARFPFGEVQVRILPDAERYAPNISGFASGMQWAYLSAVARRWELLNNPSGVADYYITVYGTENTDYTGSWWFFGAPIGRGACGLRLDGYDCIATVGNQLGLRPLAIDREAADPPFDYAFPYADTRTHVLGYDILGSEVQSPELFDLMAPQAMDGVPNWISDYHYEKAYLHLTPPAPAQQTALVAADYLYITGYAGPSDGTFHPVIHLANSPAPDDVNPVDPTGDYCVQARDGLGHVVEESCFDLDLTNIDTGTEDDLTAFTAALTDDPDIRQLLLRYQGNTIEQLVVPGSPPDVTLISASYDPIYGTAEIAWTTPLADHPDQRYHIHYSPDNGVSWIPVGIDIAPDEVVSVDGAFRWGVRGDQIPDGAQARLRLIASDGYHETAVTSGAFTVPDTGPWLEILAPADNAVIESFPVTFEGYAFDVEAGDRTAAMTWTSDRDGPLGSGDGLSVDALSAGVHTITLSADDGEGHVATDTVRVTVSGEAAATDWVFLPLVVR